MAGYGGCGGGGYGGGYEPSGYGGSGYGMPFEDGYAEEDDDMFGGHNMYTSQALTPGRMAHYSESYGDEPPLSNNFLDQLQPHDPFDGMPPPPRRDHLGMRQGFNTNPRLDGVYDGNFNERPSLLDQGFADPWFRPNPATSMGAIRGGPRLDGPQQREYTGHFTGYNDSMPYGAIGYVGRDEHRMWGQPGGPRMYSSEIVDDEFIRMREEDENWEPEGFDGRAWGDRLYPQW